MWKSGQCVSTARGRGLLHLFQYRFRSEIPESRNRNHFRCFPISFSMAKSGTPASCWIYRSCRTRILNNSARQRPPGTQILIFQCRQADAQLYRLVPQCLSRKTPTTSRQRTDIPTTNNIDTSSRIKKTHLSPCRILFPKRTPQNSRSHIRKPSRLATYHEQSKSQGCPSPCDNRPRTWRQSVKSILSRRISLLRHRGGHQRNTLAPGTWGAVTE